MGDCIEPILFNTPSKQRRMNDLRAAGIEPILFNTPSKRFTYGNHNGSCIEPILFNTPSKLKIGVDYLAFV